jgi:hypothetical protein
MSLNKVIGEFKDGELTSEEFHEILEDIRKNEDYLQRKDAEDLVALGRGSLTKRQYAQLVEYSVFISTGVTRDG